MVRFFFDESHLTHFGGMWLIQRFCNKLRPRRLIQRYVNVSGRTSTYRPPELILSHDYHHHRQFIDASRSVENWRLPRHFRICK